jgi:hypothetical protein
LGGRDKWKLDKACFYFVGEGSILRFLFGGVPLASKELMVGQSSGSYKKEEKKTIVGAPYIN